MKYALIIEDDEASRYVVNDIYAAYMPDFHLHILSDSCDYQDKLLALQGEIAIAILDIYLMNCASGVEIARWMRKQPQFANTVLVAFTADSVIESRELFDAGFSAVIIKPIRNITDFAGWIKRALAGERFVLS
jgi:CheY-like chemotaxis protein